VCARVQQLHGGLRSCCCLSLQQGRRLGGIPTIYQHRAGYDLYWMVLLAGQVVACKLVDATLLQRTTGVAA